MSMPNGAAHSQASTAIAYLPRSFSEHKFETLKVLCETIIPADRESGGAIEAGVPEWIDLLASQNKDYQLQIITGLDWLDAVCDERHGELYLACTPGQQQEILDLIAFRINGQNDPRLIPGIDFFSMLRRDTVVAFFATDVGRKYLGFRLRNLSTSCKKVTSLVLTEPGLR